MSSPFNPLAAFTPSALLAPGSNPPTAPTPANGSLPPLISPSPVFPLSLHPLLGPSPVNGGPSPNTLLALATLGASASGSGSGIGNGNGLGLVPLALPGGAGASAAGPGAEADDALRATGDIVRLLERAEVIRTEISGLENSVFVTGEGAERPPAAGGLCRLEALQLEYAQSLLTLISLSTTYLVGALPVPLSKALQGGIAPSDPAATASVSASIGGGGIPTVGDLATWTESRAGTEFARRETVRGASRAVVDVLRGSGL